MISAGRRQGARLRPRQVLGLIENDGAGGCRQLPTPRRHPCEIVGTVAYMSPEQAEGKASRRAQRCVRVRGRAVRDAVRPAPVQRRYALATLASTLQATRRDRANYERRFQPTSSASCCVAWRRSPRLATALRAKFIRRSPRRAASDDRQPGIAARGAGWSGLVMLIGAAGLWARSYVQASRTAMGGTGSRSARSTG